MSGFFPFIAKIMNIGCRYETLGIVSFFLFQLQRTLSVAECFNKHLILSVLYCMLCVHPFFYVSLSIRYCFVCAVEKAYSLASFGLALACATCKSV